jgi:two-component system KDP operon response regulator KdpE
MKQFRILVVDDEPRIIKFIKLRLKASGYQVVTAESGLEALELARREDLDLMVLDVAMPGMDGFETLAELRAFSALPVIILSAKGTSTDKIQGLDLGADDYLSKPFSPDELVARIEAARRRMARAEDRRTADTMTLGHLTIDLPTRRITADGEEVYLTRIEWLLLNELARNAGRLVTYEELLTKIWGPEYRDDVQILRTWIGRLRKKIARQPDGPAVIRTVPKTGFIIDAPAR